MAIQKFQGRFTVFWIMSRLFSSNWKTWGMTDLKQESFIVGGRIPIGFSTKSGDRRLHTCSRDFVQRAEQEAAINGTPPSQNSLTLMRCAFFGMPFGAILVSPHWGWWHCEVGGSTLASGVHHALRFSHNVTKHITTICLISMHDLQNTKVITCFARQRDHVAKKIWRWFGCRDSFCGLWTNVFYRAGSIDLLSFKLRLTR